MQVTLIPPNVLLLCGYETKISWKDPWREGRGQRTPVHLVYVILLPFCIVKESIPYKCVLSILLAFVPSINIHITKYQN